MLVQNHQRQDNVMGAELIILFLFQLLTSVVLATRLRVRPDGTQGPVGCFMVFLVIGSPVVGLAIYVVSCGSFHPPSFH